MAYARVLRRDAPSGIAGTRFGVRVGRDAFDRPGYQPELNPDGQSQAAEVAQVALKLARAPGL